MATHPGLITAVLLCLLVSAKYQDVTALMAPSRQQRPLVGRTYDGEVGFEGDDGIYLNAQSQNLGHSARGEPDSLLGAYVASLLNRGQSDLDANDDSRQDDKLHLYTDVDHDESYVASPSKRSLLNEMPKEVLSRIYKLRPHLQNSKGRMSLLGPLKHREPGELSIVLDLDSLSKMVGNRRLQDDYVGRIRSSKKKLLSIGRR